ncbi:MAG: hypothetical protein RR478_00905 [Bacilli bacterium]
MDNKNVLVNNNTKAILLDKLSLALLEETSLLRQLDINFHDRKVKSRIFDELKTTREYIKKCKDLLRIEKGLRNCYKKDNGINK